MRFTAFTKEHLDSGIYHLSLDDRTALCGRSIYSASDGYICIGEKEDDTGLLIEISGSHVLMWRCCLLCHAAFKRQADGSNKPGPRIGPQHSRAASPARRERHDHNNQG